jgi:ABC-type multidrug transport system fused ATPase/permease subunit
MIISSSLFDGILLLQITDSRRSGLAKFTTGNITNLVSNDAKRMDELPLSIIETLSIPFILVAVILSLYVLIGWQSLSGLLLTFLLIAFTLFLTKIFAGIRSHQAKVTDKRLAVMSEIISGIRAVKMYAWEWNYNDVVKNLRR